MIFADKLIDLRKRNGWSQEELAEKLEVSRQTISKWEGAQSVPDLSRMLKLSQVFGVTTDYLMKDELELAQETLPAAAEPDGAASLPVSMEAAVEYLRLRDWMAGRVALGVALCILCPVPLILLGGAADTGVLRIGENLAGGLGCVVLFLLIAAAVALFLSAGFRLRDYERWEQTPLDTAYGVDSMVRDRMEKYAPTHTRYLVLGVLLCILCPVPLLLTATLDRGDWPMVVATVALLMMVALGVQRLVLTGIRWESFTILLEIGEHTREKKAENRKNGAVAAIYWGAAVAIYLGWSFFTGSWERTWILWPVAGVSYGVLLSVLRVLRKSQ